jgi:short-subunit dehydrogenase
MSVVAIVARDRRRLEEHQAALVGDGLRSEAFVADAGDASSLASAFDQVKARLGDPEVLVYNAAILSPMVPSKLSPEQLTAEFAVDVVGALVSAQAVLPAMRAKKRGVILATGGGFADAPIPQCAALGVGKAALRNLFLSLAKEVESDAVHVCSVTIRGFIRPGTPFDPDAIAARYLEIAARPRGEWRAVESFE